MVRAQLTQFVAASVFLLAALPVSAQTESATKVISDQILPRETYLYVSCPNVSALKDFVSNSSAGQLYNDPELDAFKSEVMAALGGRLEEGLATVQEVLGISLQEFLEIPNGEVSFAFSAAPGNVMGASIYLDFGDKEVQIQELLEKAAAALSGAPMLNREDDTFDGTDLTLFKIQHDGPPPTPLAVEFGWFVKDQRLVISNRQELLESALTNWSGESSESFLSNDAYAYIMSKCQSSNRSALSTIFFDPIGMATKLIQTGSLGPQLTMGASMGLGFLPQLGLTQLKAMGSVSEAGTGDFEVVSNSVFYAEQPPMGLMQMMQLDPVEAAPPAWVKDDVSAYASVKWKIAEAYTAVESIADMFAGAGALAGQIDNLADGELGIHIKEDIIDQLTGGMRFISAPGPRDSVGADQMLVALDVKDDEAAQEVAALIADLTRLDDREFRGTTIYEKAIPGNEGQAFSMAVADGKLLVGMGATILEQVIRNDSDATPLAESEDYRRVSQHFPGQVLGVQFGRPAQQYRGFYELLRSGKMAEQFPGSQDLFEEIDFTTLPAFEVLEKYIHPTGGYTVADDNGFMMKAYQLKD